MIFELFRRSIAGYVTEEKVEKDSKEPRKMVNKQKFHIFKRINNY
jgi:hypothetical protein